MTYIIIIITLFISIPAFSRPDLISRLSLNPYQIIQRKEWYRLISHAFVHANWMHLIINMYVLYAFGRYVEYYFEKLAAQGLIDMPQMHFLIMYIGSILVSVLTTLKKHKNDYMYSAVGASGAVSAIVFTFIFFAPWEKIYFFFVLPIPAIVFGILYLAYSQYMSHKEGDNINHDAHFLGALFGMIYPVLINPELFFVFINHLTGQ
ncbi:MAG: rhomboid family intramembrane serine protease [Bacteroidota bacterium]